MRGQAVAAITGLGASALGRQVRGTARELAASAVVAAIRDAGLSGADVNGLILARSPLQNSADLPLRLQMDLALRDLALLTAIDASGTSFIQAIQVAVMAVQLRQAEHVVCVFADSPISAAISAQTAFSRAMLISGVEGWEESVGLFGAAGAFGLMAQDWLAVRGYGASHLSGYVRAVRRWAALNPLAQQKRGLTLDEYLASPFVAEPLRMADCAYPVNGAVAVVVSRLDHAASARHAVYINAMAQGHTGDTRLSGSTCGEASGAALAARRLYASAGIGPHEMAMVQAYDAFSFLGLMTLEDYGLCPYGEAGLFVLADETAPGGRLPMNTGGGHLAGFYLQGATPVHEALLQLRGQGGLRQADTPGPALVTGVGGRYEHHAALILSADRQL